MHNEELSYGLLRLQQLEAETAAQLLQEAPKNGSSEALAEYALQTSFLRGQLAAFNAARAALSTPKDSSEDAQ